MAEKIVPLSATDLLQAGDTFDLQFSSTAYGLIIVPSDQEVLQALSSDSRYSPQSFSHSISSELNPTAFGGTVRFKMNQGSPQQVGWLEISLNNQLSSIHGVVGTSIDEVDKVSQSFSLAPSVSTDVFIVALAIILIVGLIFWFQLKPAARAAGVA